MRHERENDLFTIMTEASKRAETLSFVVANLWHVAFFVASVVIRQKASR